MVQMSKKKAVDLLTALDLLFIQQRGGQVSISNVSRHLPGRVKQKQTNKQKKLFLRETQQL